MFRKTVIALVFCIIFSVNTANANIPFCGQSQKTQEVMALSRNCLCSDTNKVGDSFTAKIVDAFIYKNEEIIPAGSIVYGNVTGISHQKRMSKSGKIDFKITQIETPSGKKISLDNKPIKGQIVPAGYKDFTETALERAPMSIASAATTMAIDAASDVSSFVLYPIGLGVSIVTGAVTGFIYPSKGKTKLQSATQRAYDVTPLGYCQYVLSTGEKANLNTGDAILLNITAETIAKIKQENMS